MDAPPRLMPGGMPSQIQNGRQGREIRRNGSATEEETFDLTKATPHAHISMSAPNLVPLPPVPEPPAISPGLQGLRDLQRARRSGCRHRSPPIAAGRVAIGFSVGDSDAILRHAMRRGLVFTLLPLSILLAAAAAITYFVWWDATHCTFCRTRLDEFGRCPNPDCHLGRLTREQESPPSATRCRTAPQLPPTSSSH